MRKNFFFIFFTLSLFLIYVFLIVSIDLKYQVDKKEYIVNNFRSFFDFDRSRILGLIKRIEQDEELLHLLTEEFTQIIENPEQAIFSIALIDDQNRILLQIENDRKLRTHNTLKTALFFQNFTGLYSFGEDGLAYNVECTYTTPEKDVYIQEMTMKYWVIILLSSPFFLIFYLLIIKYYILPVKKVINSLLMIPRKENVLVPAPLTLLEKSFNLVGLYYQLLSFTNSIYEEIFSRKSLRSEMDLEQLVIDFIPGFFPCKKVLCQHYPVTEATQLPPTGLVDRNALPLKQQNGQKSDNTTLVGLRVPLKDDILYFVLFFEEDNPHLMSFNFDEFLRRFEHILFLMFNYTRLKSTEIIEEKQRANVNLLRNLGHDLTNILATLKLEIANLSFLVQNKETKDTEFSSKECTLLLKRIRDNARFLQDIVDIYRSLSFMDDPRYETVDLNKILDYTFQLFKQATSHKIQWILHKPDKKISKNVEPRLLRLALFNILSNAYDSVKVCQSEKFIPRIEAGVKIATDNPEEVVISIRDNGTGICDHKGKLLSGNALNTIFEYGYTTKKKGKGEGLGLSWVKTIIEDFHQGKISVINLPERGACFEIRLESKQ